MKFKSLFMKGIGISFLFAIAFYLIYNNYTSIVAYEDIGEHYEFTSSLNGDIELMKADKQTIAEIEKLAELYSKIFDISPLELGLDSFYSVVNYMGIEYTIMIWEEMELFQKISMDKKGAANEFFPASTMNNQQYYMVLNNENKMIYSAYRNDGLEYSEDHLQMIEVLDKQGKSGVNSLTDEENQVLNKINDILDNQDNTRILEKNLVLKKITEVVSDLGLDSIKSVQYSNLMNPYVEPLTQITVGLDSSNYLVFIYNHNYQSFTNLIYR